jgi:3-phenylpropionate/cinnamic acid dioxygenase small subunit
MLRDRASAIRKALVYAPRRMRHILGYPQILDFDRDAVKARTNLAVYVTGPSGEAKLLVTGEYVDRIRLDSGSGPCFVEKSVLYDNPLLPDSIIYPL